MEKVRDYEKRRYRGVDQKIIHKREHGIIKQFINVRAKPGDTVLDLPVGYGRFIPELLRNELNVKGVDAKEDMLRRVKERFGDLVDLHKGLADNIPFKDRQFDGFISIRLFQHIHNREERCRIFAETRRVTSRWGVITLYTPSLFHSVFRRFRKGKRLTVIPFDQAHEELAEAGWRIVSWKPLSPAGHCQTILLLEPSSI